jgi:hypothetical protein
MPAIWVNGNNRDHVSPLEALRNLLDAVALAMRAEEVSAISLGVPVLPLVATRSEISDRTDVE